MSNPLARKITIRSLIKVTTPTIIMMLFMSFYTMVDGIFVSRFVNTSALSAVNVVYPFIYIVIGIGIMLATGGSAVIAKQMGEHKARESKESFSLLICFGIIIGMVINIKIGRAHV